MENLATWSVREATLILDTNLTISIFDRDTIRHALHELGHADQAARSPLQYRRDLRNIRDKKGIIEHDRRPGEKYAISYERSSAQRGIKMKHNLLIVLFILCITVGYIQGQQIENGDYDSKSVVQEQLRGIRSITLLVYVDYEIPDYSTIKDEIYSLCAEKLKNEGLDLNAEQRSTSLY